MGQISSLGYYVIRKYGQVHTIKHLKQSFYLTFQKIRGIATTIDLFLKENMRILISQLNIQSYYILRQHDSSDVPANIETSIYK